MRTTSRRTVVGLLLTAALLAACASDDPYSAPGPSANQTLPRAPVVAPSGPGSPWWWIMPDSWWPIQPWGEPLNR